MRRFVFAVLLTIPAIAFASVPFEATIEEMAVSADHVLIGRVAGVDMIDARGNKITDPASRTGPGLKNQIRLRIKVDVVIATNAALVPKEIFVPLASHLHYSLGQIQAAHAEESEQRLILLKGERFEGIKPGVFMRPLKETARVMRLRGCKGAQALPKD